MKKASDSIKVQTNTTKDSICSVEIKPITFSELWDNYVTGSPVNDKKYQNQCAIRLSYTFHKVGIKMKSFTSKTIKPMPGADSIGRILHDGNPVATRAYELGQWLKLVPFCGLPQKPEDITGKDWESKVKGRTGIIMFHAYWMREGESSASGGHIDLWNGSRLTISGFFDSFATMGRSIGINSFFAGTDFGWSDLANSKLILFFPIK